MGEGAAQRPPGNEHSGNVSCDLQGAPELVPLLRGAAPLSKKREIPDSLQRSPNANAMVD